MPGEEGTEGKERREGREGKGGEGRGRQKRGGREGEQGRRGKGVWIERRDKLMEFDTHDSFDEHSMYAMAVLSHDTCTRQHIPGSRRLQGHPWAQVFSPTCIDSVGKVVKRAVIYCGILWCTVINCSVLWYSVVYCGIL